MRSRWLVALVVACLTSGCAVISSGGPAGEQIKGQDAPLSKPYHRLIAVPPQQGWDAAQIVEGLQTAMAGVDDPSWGVLRQYLVGGRQKSWSANGPITVLDKVNVDTKPGTPVDAPNPQVELTGFKVGVLYEDGRYVPNAPTAYVSTFGLISTKEGYRVSELLDGLVLELADLSRAYRQANLYYLSHPPGVPTQGPSTVVVPDPVWVRVDPKVDLVRTIIERLVKGPSKALEGAVHSVIPPGARLESVREVEERIVVDFAAGFHVSRSEERVLRAQLAWTLSDVAQGRTIELTVAGEPYYGSDPLTVVPDDTKPYQLSTPATPYYVNGGALYVSEPKAAGKVVDGAAGQKSDLYTDHAISPGGDYVAAKSSTGIWVARLATDGRWEEWIKGTDLTAPTWHRDGTLWTVNRSTSEVLVYKPQDQQQPLMKIAAPGLTGVIDQMKIARDGVRVAVVNRDGKGTHISVGAITGGAFDLMIKNFQPLMTVKEDERVLGISWSDSTHLFVLAELKQGVVIKNIDLAEGTTTDVSPDKSINSIAALNSRLLAGTNNDKGAKDVLEWRDGKDWKPMGEGVAGTPLFTSG